MTQLKTLKDIAERFGGRSIADTEPLRKGFCTMTDDEITETVHVLNHLWKDLRYEAIKWLKEYEAIKWLKEFKKGDATGKDNPTTPFLDEDSNSFDTVERWIKHFFNIDESELK